MGSTLTGLNIVSLNIAWMVSPVKSNFSIFFAYFKHLFKRYHRAEIPYKTVGFFDKNTVLWNDRKISVIK